MAKRKKTDWRAFKILVIGIGVLLVIKCLSEMPERESTTALTIILAYCLGVLLLLKVLIPLHRQRRVFAFAASQIHQHQAALLRRRSMLMRTDAYGKVIYDKWHAEIEYFLNRYIRDDLPKGLRPTFEKNRKEVFARISSAIEIAATQTTFTSMELSEDLSPAEFETRCAAVLRDQGWNAQATAVSRDQGVDVIAEKGALRVVLQCKLYATPVGNKAVQEVVAGRAHYQALFGAVVTNTSYTSAAEQLARSNGVLLLHFSDLPKLEEMLTIQPA
jgi:restriction system protein